MPAILVVILSAFLSSLVAKVLLGAGLAVVTFYWVNDLVFAAQEQMQGLLYNLPSDVVGLLGILKIPQALSVVMSAIGTATFIRTAKVAIGKAS